MKNLKTAGEPERVQKILAQAGYGSRRQIEKWLEQGRITINRETAILGQKVTPSDEITLDGKVLTITAAEELPCRVILYHKPEGEICTRKDPEGRPTVFEQLPKMKKARWIMIGRLDINTSGLLLFTTNGELANLLMHPGSDIEREYAVRVYGEVDAGMLLNLQRGVELDGQVVKFKRITSQGGDGKNQWFHVVVNEGKYREVRRLWETQGLVVSRLIRIRYGDIMLPRDLHLGHWRDLAPRKIQDLGRSLGLKLTPYVKQAK